MQLDVGGETGQACRQCPVGQFLFVDRPRVTEAGQQHRGEHVEAPLGNREVADLLVGARHVEHPLRLFERGSRGGRVTADPGDVREPDERVEPSKGGPVGQRQRLPRQVLRSGQLGRLIGQGERGSPTYPHPGVRVVAAVGGNRSQPVPVDGLFAAGRSLAVNREHPCADRPQLRAVQMLLKNHQISCEPALQLRRPDGHVLPAKGLRPVLPLVDADLAVQRRRESCSDQLRHSGRRHHGCRQSAQ